MFFFLLIFCFSSYIIQGKASGNTAKSNMVNKRAKKNKHRKDRKFEQKELEVTKIKPSVCKHEYEAMKY